MLLSSWNVQIRSSILVHVWSIYLFEFMYTYFPVMYFMDSDLIFYLFLVLVLFIFVESWSSWQTVLLPCFVCFCATVLSSSVLLEKKHHIQNYKASTSFLNPWCSDAFVQNVAYSIKTLVKRSLNDLKKNTNKITITNITFYQMCFLLW